MSSVQFHCNLAAQSTPLPHSWEACIGSGHAPLALRADWQAQLRRVHAGLGMQQLRFHGLLSDDMGTLICHREQPLYSFLNLDRIFDFLLELEMRPFVELSFMPRMLASGDATVFAYRANVSPPRALGQWQSLLTRLARHLIGRYGAARVRSWNFEVWNEPNQPQFWPAGRDSYFALYDASHAALKRVDAQLRVGGPATSKNAWLPEFLAHCRQSGHPPDFISTHHYPTDAVGDEASDTVAQLAHAARHALRDQARAARAQAGALPLYYTEWNTSSNPRDRLHDEPYAAAAIVSTVLELAATVDCYSYWTFSDIFAENYFPARAFHGGFGLLNPDGIAKPAYRAFELLHQAGDEALPVQGRHPTVAAWVTRASGRLMIYLVNHAMPRHALVSETVRLTLANCRAAGAATLRRIDSGHAHARAHWVAMGSPERPSQGQNAALEQASRLQAEPLELHAADGALQLELRLPPHGVACIAVPLAPAAPAQQQPMLDAVGRETWDYFWHEYAADTGLVADSSRPGAPASVAVTGMALSCYPVAVERGYCARAEAARRALAALRFFQRSEQSEADQASGWRGFYYHFLDMHSGRRVWDSELSTIDSALLAAGMLTAAYFDRDTPDERELRGLAHQLYRRIDWCWALDGGAALRHGWRPGGRGFLPYRWEGYNEALLLYILGLGSPTHALPESAYAAWCAGYAWKQIYGHEVLYGGPLFMHQLSHCWLDLRAIQDAPMRSHRSDYFENSRRAVLIQQEYAARNPLRMAAYGPLCWGISAGQGPGPCRQRRHGIDRQFLGYAARGAPFGPDDGTMLPAALAAALPFAPELVLPSLVHLIEALHLKAGDRYGFAASFNAEFAVADAAPGQPQGWVSPWHYGLNQGPVVLMLENYRSGLIWRLLRHCPYIVSGLRRAGFSGGWLEPA